MLVTQKKQYALRAIFELAKQKGDQPVKSSTIAEAQSIPLRFLEVILGQLKRAGVVASKRGFFGGYNLIQPPDRICVGDIFRMLDREDGSPASVPCSSKGSCPFRGSCVFLQVWDQAEAAMNSVYDQTTIQDLIDQEGKQVGPDSLLMGPTLAD
jgi:Rrf2 family protein